MIILFIMDKLINMNISMDMEFYNIKMGLCFKVIGKIIKLVEKVNFKWIMMTYMKEILQTINLMALESMLSAKMKLDMKVNGKIIYKMDREKKYGKMVLSLMVNLLMDRKMVMVNSNGLIKINIKENG